MRVTDDLQLERSQNFAPQKFLGLQDFGFVISNSQTGARNKRCPQNYLRSLVSHPSLFLPFSSSAHLDSGAFRVPIGRADDLDLVEIVMVMLIIPTFAYLFLSSFRTAFRLVSSNGIKKYR